MALAVAGVILMTTALRDPIEDGYARAKSPVAATSSGGSTLSAAWIVGAARAVDRPALDHAAKLHDAAAPLLRRSQLRAGRVWGDDRPVYVGRRCGHLRRGFLGDSFNRRMVVFLSMMISVPFSYGLLHGQALPIARRFWQAYCSTFHQHSAGDGAAASAGAQGHDGRGRAGFISRQRRCHCLAGEPVG